MEIKSSTKKVNVYISALKNFKSFNFQVLKKYENI